MGIANANSIALWLCESVSRGWRRARYHVPERDSRAVRQTAGREARQPDHRAVRRPRTRASSTPCSSACAPDGARAEPLIKAGGPLRHGRTSQAGGRPLRHVGTTRTGGARSTRQLPVDVVPRRGVLPVRVTSEPGCASRTVGRRVVRSDRVADPHVRRVVGYRRPQAWYPPSRSELALRAALAVLDDVDHAFGKYVRGIFLECCSLGLTVMVFLIVVGIPLRWPIAIGIFTGASNVIPYMGFLAALLGGLRLRAPGRGHSSADPARARRAPSRSG